LLYYALNISNAYITDLVDKEYFSCHPKGISYYNSGSRYLSILHEKPFSITND